jgi:hypothetical protein
MVTIFTNVDYAIEEAEFLTEQTGRSHAIVGLPEKDGDIEQYAVMERSQAVSTHAVILETFRVMNKEPTWGIH